MDPITRSLLDTDFYKLLMLQFIWKNFPRTNAKFTLINRTTSVQLGKIVSVEQLREQLQATRRLRFRKSELVWLVGNTFYGRRGIFEPAFLDWLEHEFELSDFELSVHDGQLQLQFEGLWSGTSMWEIYALSEIGELKTRATLKDLSEFELDILYARAKTRLWEKMERLRGVPDLSISDFGTRRRHSFLWHEYVVNSMRDTIGECFSGTSNAYLAYKHNLEAIGTNGHELPMAMAALACDDEELRNSQYALLDLWQRSYQGELLILLPDTFGTTQFLRGAPEWVTNWTGQRIDSKDAYVAATNTSPGLSATAPTRARSASSPATHSTSSRFLACMPTSPEPCSTAPRLTISAPRATSSIPAAGFPIAASDSAPVGARCSQTTFVVAIRKATTPSTPSASSAS